MKTRSQTKREKQKIPRLNEDVFGIILQHVIKKQRDRVMTSLKFIGNHFDGCEDMYDYCTKRDNCLYYHDKSLGDYVEWPHQIETNSQRLVYHTKIKLFPNIYFENQQPLHNMISSSRELDLLLETFRHFSYVFNCHCDLTHGEMTPTEFIQELQDHLDTRESRSRFLVELLEKTNEV